VERLRRRSPTAFERARILQAKLRSLKAPEDTRTGSLSSLNGAKRQPPSSPHSMRKETSDGHSLLLRRQQSTHLRASLFHIAKEYSKQGFSGWDRLIGRLELAVGQSPDAIGIESLHPEIYAKCRNLYEGADYAEAVEKSFKLVGDRLRALTGYETGSDAFGKGLLYIVRAAATDVDEDFQNGVKFLTMAIDRFRNEKSHTESGNISDPIRAYEYLRLSSLVMHLLEGAQRRSS
jgi:uncharacterized protein (TIGR02391 family)